MWNLSEKMIKRNEINYRPDGAAELKLLGQGTYGTVYRAKYKNRYVAVKELRFMDDNRYQEYIREICSLIQFTYPSILPLIGYVLQSANDPALIVTPLMEGGTLSDLISKSRENPENFDDTKKMIIIIGIIAAMRYLHKNDIMHRDLKPLNVLLNENLEPIVADFGLSKHVGANNMGNQTMDRGTPLFMAPEQFGDSYDNSIDVYAFGCILYNIFKKEPPFSELPNSFIVCSYVTSGKRPEIPSDVPENYHKLIKQCWDGEPTKRPTFEQLYNDFLKGELNLPEADLSKVQKYIEVLKQADSPSTDEILKENEKLKRENELLRAGEIWNKFNFGIGVAQKLYNSRSTRFERKFYYSRSSYDIHYCLGQDAPGFFGYSGPNLYVQFDFPNEICIQGCYIQTYDESFQRNWAIYIIDKEGRQTLVYQCDEIPNYDKKKVSALFQPAKGYAIRICKTGGQEKLSFNKLEFFDQDNKPLFGSMIDTSNRFKVPFIVTSSDFICSYLQNPNCEFDVFTRNIPNNNWIQLNLDNPITATGYRIKRNKLLTLKSWSFAGSNDGVNWVTLDTQNDYAENERVVEIRCPAQTSFKLFRIIPKVSPQTNEKCVGFICHFDVFD